jgi:FKBP-type peptidyl-prolyl cis-trans isomerase
MKLRPVALLPLLVVAFVSGCGKSSSTPGATAATPTKPGAAAAPAAGDFSDAKVIEAYGWYIGERTGVADLGFSAEETEALLRGIRGAAGGQKSPFDMNVYGPKLDEVLGKRQDAAMAKVREKNTAEGTAFFAKLKDNKAVTLLPSGLGYEVLKGGSGPAPKATDTVKVHYEGRFLDGTVFDSSVERGEPAEFPLDGVIPGWTEGLQKTSKGGKIRLYVPAKLAYGDQGRPGMPPAATLLFDVELLEINPVAPPPAALQAAPAK